MRFPVAAYLLISNLKALINFSFPPIALNNVLKESILLKKAIRDMRGSESLRLVSALDREHVHVRVFLHPLLMPDKNSSESFPSSQQ